MLKVLFRSAVILCLAILLYLCVGAIFIFPYQITTDLALGQLENSDVNFAMLETWNRMRNIGYGLDGLITAGSGVWIGYEFIKYFKNK